MRVFCADHSSSAREPARRTASRIPVENLRPLFPTPVEAVGRQRISWPAVSSGGGKDRASSSRRERRISRSGLDNARIPKPKPGLCPQLSFQRTWQPYHRNAKDPLRIPECEKPSYRFLLHASAKKKLRKSS